MHAVGNLWCIVSARFIVLGRLLSAAISSLICEVRPYGIGRFCPLLKLGFWAILHISLQLFFAVFYYLWQPVGGVVYTCTYMGIIWLHTQQYSLKSPFNNERIGAICIWLDYSLGLSLFYHQIWKHVSKYIAIVVPKKRRLSNLCLTHWKASIKPQN